MLLFTPGKRCTGVRMMTQRNALLHKVTMRLLWVSGLLAFSGCATLEQRLPEDTPTATVLSHMGRPDITCPLDQGGQRLVWSGQPFLQASWGTDATAAGVTTGVKQLLTDASFAQLRQGEWHADKVRCTFGPPGEISGVGWLGNTQSVWSYSYKQDGVWNSLMHVYFDEAGYVTKFHPGPDPLYDPDRRFPLW